MEKITDIILSLCVLAFFLFLAVLQQPFWSRPSSTFMSSPFLLLFRAVVSTVTVYLCKVPYTLCNFLSLLSWLSSPQGLLRAHSLTTWKRVFLPALSNPLSLKVIILSLSSSPSLFSSPPYPLLVHSWSFLTRLLWLSRDLPVFTHPVLDLQVHPTMPNWNK